MNERVMVFTASGTFRGESGRVTERLANGDALVHLDGEKTPMRFAKGEMVSLAEPHVGGAE